MNEKVPNVAVIALLILQKFGCAITDSANAGEGSTLCLPVSAFMKLNGNNAFLQMLYLQSLQQQHCYPPTNLPFLTDHIFYTKFLISQVKYENLLKVGFFL